MHVQYFLKTNERSAHPLMRRYGGGLTGVSFRDQPNGGEGWLNDLLCRGVGLDATVDVVERPKALAFGNPHMMMDRGLVVAGLTRDLAGKGLGW